MRLPKIALHWQILIALALGIIFGIFFTEQVRFVEWMGDIFLRSLQMIIIPLILTSIVSGIAQIGSGKNFGRLGIKTLSYYIGTSLLAIVTGLSLVNLIKPGIGADLGLVREVEGIPEQAKSFGRILIEIIPTNIFEAMSGGQMLPVIFFALIFGFFITQVSDKSKTTLTDLFQAGFEVIMKMTLLIIKLTPLGVFAIISGNVARILLENGEGMGALLNIGGKLGMYMLTVFIGLVIHAGISLPLILRFIGRVSPVKHFRAVSTPLITAFSTSSSMATLPLTLEAVEHNSGVSNRISSFTLPLGGTINMDGTALYECVAAMFIAQAYGMDMSFGQQVLVVFTALVASIGAAGVPMAGMFMVTIILAAIGLPLEAVGMIIAVDRVLDMFRTATNVWSDTTAAIVIARSEGEKLLVDLDSV